jgi:rRNA biogenesis protein RRP5
MYWNDANMLCQRLNVGMTMLGCISKINDLNLVVSLPHQLVGSVAITEISEPITKAVEAVAQAEEEDEEGVLPDLANLFKVGQWVRCCIIQLSGSDEQQGVSLDKRSKTKKRIDLSLKPEIVNNGVIVNDLAKGMVCNQNVIKCLLLTSSNHTFCLVVGYVSTKRRRSWLHLIYWYRRYQRFLPQ